MRAVTVNRTELMTVLRRNRDNHRAVFEKAQEGYRARVIEELDKMIAAARRGDKVRVYVGLDAPEDHTDDYDRVLGMLEMSVDETVEVDAASFEAYVRDKWNWSQTATVKNTAYASGGVFRSHL